MNIKQHIEAGHDPTDDNGHSLVPHVSEGTVIVYSTNGPEGYSIIGRHNEMHEHAVTIWLDDSDQLRAPPPRKVKVTAWVLFHKGEPCNVFNHQFAPSSGMRLVEMKGEYEEPWS